MFVVSSNYTVESHHFDASHERSTALHPVSEQTVDFKSTKFGSVDCVAVDDSLSSDNTSSCVLSKGPEYTSKHTKRDLQVKCPLSYATSGLCDHNGGVLTSKDGDFKLTIPKDAIKEGDFVTLSIASDLYGPFVLPSNCQADVVSPYYWVAVSESYHFQKPVKVEFQHFAVVTACHPLHYQLLYCEDDDESHTMQPVATDCSPRFTVQDDISWCTFYTDHFCSYCLCHGCKDPIITRIVAIYLKTKDSYPFTKEIWFSFPIAQCMKRNEELYTKRGMVLVHNGYIFEAPCDKSSTHFFTLTYHQDFDGWNVKHCQSNTIATKEINFYNYYKTKKELKALEKISLFPQRFVVNVTKKSECSTDLDTVITIRLHKNGEEILKSITFPLFIPISQFVDRLTTSTGNFL